MRPSPRRPRGRAFCRTGRQQSPPYALPPAARDAPRVAAAAAVGVVVVGLAAPARPAAAAPGAPALAAGFDVPAVDAPTRRCPDRSIGRQPAGQRRAEGRDGIDVGAAAADPGSRRLVVRRMGAALALRDARLAPADGQAARRRLGRLVDRHLRGRLARFSLPSPSDCPSASHPYPHPYSYPHPPSLMALIDRTPHQLDSTPNPKVA